MFSINLVTTERCVLSALAAEERFRLFQMTR